MTWPARSIPPIRTESGARFTPTADARTAVASGWSPGGRPPVRSLAHVAPWLVGPAAKRAPGAVGGAVLPHGRREAEPHHPAVGVVAPEALGERTEALEKRSHRSSPPILFLSI